MLSDPEAGLIAVRSEENDYRGNSFPEIKDEEKQLIKRVVQGYDLKSSDVRQLMTRYSEAKVAKKQQRTSGKKAKLRRRL